MELFDDFLKEELKDPELKAEYDALEPEYNLINTLIESQIELYKSLEKGIDDVKKGHTKPFDTAMEELKQKWGLK